MAESSARREAQHTKSGDKSISTSTAAAEGGHGPRHRKERLKSWLKRPFNSASLNPPSTSSLNAALLPEKDDDDKWSGDGLVSTELTGGKKSEASSPARSGPGTAKASHSTSHNRNDSRADRNCDAAFLDAAPIAELWDQAFEQLREEDPKLVKKYEAQISLHVSTMVGTTVAISGLGKVQRREQMEVLVKKKLEEDEDGKWRIPLGDDHIAIRDLARHVVSIVDWGKEFVGSALEPSPYGSIAWAGVCLLLPVSTFSSVGID